MVRTAHPTRLHAERREIARQIKERTPKEIRERIYHRNIDRYKDPLGPTFEWLVKEGKSWEQIIESASKTGGKDLGF